MDNDAKSNLPAQIQNHRPRGLPLRACTNCGVAWKYTHYCPAEEVTCNSCGKIGHFARFCMSSRGRRSIDGAKQSNNCRRKSGRQGRRSHTNPPHIDHHGQNHGNNEGTTNEQAPGELHRGAEGKCTVPVIKNKNEDLEVQSKLNQANNDEENCQHSFESSRQQNPSENKQIGAWVEAEGQIDTNTNINTTNCPGEIKQVNIHACKNPPVETIELVEKENNQNSAEYTQAKKNSEAINGNAVIPHQRGDFAGKYRAQVGEKSSDAFGKLQKFNPGIEDTTRKFQSLGNFDTNSINETFVVSSDLLSNTLPHTATVKNEPVETASDDKIEEVDAEEIVGNEKANSGEFHLICFDDAPNQTYSVTDSSNPISVVVPSNSLSTGNNSSTENTLKTVKRRYSCPSSVNQLQSNPQQNTGNLSKINTKHQEFLCKLSKEAIDSVKSEAMSLYKQGKYQAAVVYCSKLIALRPTEEINYSNRAVCFMALEKYRDALDDALVATQLNPLCIKGYSRAIKCATFVGGEVVMEACLNKLSTLDPRNEIIPVARKNLQILKEQTNIFLNAAKMKNYKTALDAINTYLSISPQSELFRMNKAEYLARLELYDEAERIVNKMQVTGKNTVSATYLLAKRLYDSDIDQALKYIQHILLHQPTSVEIIAMYQKAKKIVAANKAGDDAANAKDWDAAHRMYSSALIIDPAHVPVNSQLYYKMAQVSYKAQNFRRAVTEYTLAMANDSNNSELLRRRGMSYMNLGDYERAISDFSRVNLLKPGDTCHHVKKVAENLLEIVKKNNYKILGVDDNATLQTIKKAYRDKAMRYHPDRQFVCTEEQRKHFDETFKDIMMAYRGVFKSTYKK